MPKDLSIVIPAYNERLRLPRYFDEIYEYAERVDDDGRVSQAQAEPSCYDNPPSIENFPALPCRISRCFR